MSAAREAREIAVVEDERNLRELLHDLLEAQGHQVRSFATAAAAQEALASHAPDLLLVDVRLPDGDGLELLARLRRDGLRCPAIAMTAFGTLERAVQALRAGAADFLVKPFPNERLLAAVEEALSVGRRLEEVALAAATLAPESETARAIIGAGGGLREVVELLPRVAASDATVLLQGESGTGKEIIARALHAASPRLDGPFVSVNCAALPPSLLESELFGFERGAFTGAHARRKGLIESAEGGTLFLDEIGDMSPDAQARLLRVLQERELTRVGGREVVKVDLRVIAATHRDLALLAKQGGFREDLLYRLAVVPIRLPPLRDRRQDIPGLLAHFLGRHSSVGRPLPLLDAPTLRAATAWGWPGNVRELQNWVERAAVLGRFDLAALAPTGAPDAPPARHESGVLSLPVRPLREAVAEAERGAVVAALRAAKGNKAEAARLLGVSYKTLFNKIHEHDIREALSID